MKKKFVFHHFSRFLPLFFIFITIPLLLFAVLYQNINFQKKAKELTPFDNLKEDKSKNFQPIIGEKKEELDLFFRSTPPTHRFKEKPLIPSRDVQAADLDITYISRSPGYDYDGVKQWPEENEIVTFTAHIKNRGTIPTGDFTYVWKTEEGSQVISSPRTANSLAPGEKKEVAITWRWQHQVIDQSIQGSHYIEFIADPQNSIPEISETNNSLKDYTQALSIGFWVEEKVYDYFNQHQFEYCHDKFCAGSNSWDDWAQRQVATFNSLLANSKSSQYPNGAVDRVRLDKITIVPNCTIPSDYRPAVDKTVDLIWGFTSAKIEPVENCQRDIYDSNKGHYIRYPFFQDLEYPLIHELSHARYLIDLYGLNVEEEDVLVTERGMPIVRTLYLPILLYDIVYLSKAQGIMGIGDYTSGYDPHSIGALNRVKGRRARGGNYNAPSVIGEYLYDLPATTKFQFLTSRDESIPNASIKIFRAKPHSGKWYGQTFSGTPDLEGITDESGVFSYRGNIFGDRLSHTYGYSNIIFLYRLQLENQVSYGFQEITDLNLAYWRGETEQATIPIIVNMPTPNPTSTPTSTSTPTPTVTPTPTFTPSPTLQPTPTLPSNPINFPPVINTQALQEGQWGRYYSQSVVATDRNQDQMTMNVFGLPFSIRKNTCSQTGGSLTCPIRGRPWQRGTFQVRIEVTDNKGTRNSKILPLIVYPLDYSNQ